MNRVRHILYVSDNKETFLNLQNLIPKKGPWSYKLSQAICPKEAFNNINTSEYDLFILDHNKKNKIATNFIDQYISYFKTRPPFILLTDQADDSGNFEDEASQMGALDYLAKKELDVTTLKKTLNNIIKFRTLYKSLWESEQELIHKETHDTLTGTANRVVFYDHLNLAIERSKRSQKTYAVLILDLDRFKWINDSLGHTAGDEMLKIVTEKLKRVIRPSDTLSRLGGDEFAILIEDLAPSQNIQQSSTIAMRLLDLLAEPLEIQGQIVYASASIGIVMGNSTYEKADQVVRDADIAMYRAKEMGKGCYQYYDPGMHEQAVENLKIVSDLQHALTRDDELTMFYQPLINMRTKKIIGYESLIRWQHPKRGLLSPGFFLPQAEDAGMMGKIGDYVLQHSLREFSEYLKAHPGDQYVSVNLAAEQIINYRIIDDIRALLGEYNLDPHHIQIEITENSIMKSPELANKILTKFRDMGMKIAIDDFGSGYSSLSYLQKFPVSTIKIDQSFVTNIRDNTGNIEIVRMITVLADAIGSQVIAEGVETEEDQNILLELGCTYAQGYYYGKPEKEFKGALKKDIFRQLTG